MPLSLSTSRPAITSNNPFTRRQCLLGLPELFQAQRSTKRNTNCRETTKSQGGSQQSRTALVGAGGSSLRLQLWQPTRSAWQVAIYWLAIAARPQFPELKHKLGSDKAPRLKRCIMLNVKPLLWALQSQSHRHAADHYSNLLPAPPSPHQTNTWLVLPAGRPSQ